MEFRAAAEFKLSFGKYKGKTLDRIAETDEGLLYLDWLLGERDNERGDSRSKDVVSDALYSYLSDNAIRSELDKLQEGDS